MPTARPMRSRHEGMKKLAHQRVGTRVMGRFDERMLTVPLLA
jgi:hypothetical protein